MVELTNWNSVVACFSAMADTGADTPAKSLELQLGDVKGPVPLTGQAGYRDLSNRRYGTYKTSMDD